jgi:hypothetical protein
MMTPPVRNPSNYVLSHHNSDDSSGNSRISESESDDNEVEVIEIDAAHIKQEENQLRFAAQQLGIGEMSINRLRRLPELKPFSWNSPQPNPDHPGPKHISHLIKPPEYWGGDRNKV